MRVRLVQLLAVLSLSCACVQYGANHPEGSAGASAAHELAQAASFETEPAPHALRGDARDKLLEAALGRGCGAAGLVPDGRLAELALAVARASDGARRPPSYALVSFHAHRVGLPEPTPQVWLASGPDTRALAPALEQAAREAARTSHLTHCGAAALREGGGLVVALALSTRVFALEEPVPRRVERGATIVFEAALARGYERPMIALTDPGGGVTRDALGERRKFVHEVRAEQAGEYTIELLANGPEGLTVVAMLPVAVEVPLETEAPRFDSEPVEVDATEVANRLLELIALEREYRSLTPLRPDPRLSRIAVTHSQDMVSHGFIAHTSKLTGDATARVKSAGLEAYVVLENIGRGYSALELHRGLMESPGHRGNILHPDAREIGIGVVAEREGDRLAFIATELFTQLAPQPQARANRR